MKIQLTIYPSGGIECESNECPNLKECANHGSAGDHRYEGGLSPDLKITSMFLGGAKAICYSSNLTENEIYNANRGAKVYKNGRVKRQSFRY